MSRSAASLVIVVLLVLYALDVGRYLPGLLVAPPTTALLLAFSLQVASALAAAIGVWTAAPWTPGVLVLLGASVAATWLYEAFGLGIVAYLRALLVSVCAVIVTLALAAYVSSRPRPSHA